MVKRYAHLSSEHLSVFAGNAKNCDKLTALGKSGRLKMTEVIEFNGVGDGARTRDNRNHNPIYNKQHHINQLVIRLPQLITNVNKSNKALMILHTVAKSLHNLKNNPTIYEN
ncbi:hypothetical protein [Methylobacter svalbardensis]|uniref:hypothetical protein n=1 Tax=Methylobacter svalbardensis TaxID=3080016 RepID=UPI0030EBCDC6